MAAKAGLSRMRWYAVIAGPLRRVLRRGGPRLFDLDVLEQWVVRTLARFGDCGYGRVEAELRAIRGATPAEVVAALLKLEQAGVLEREPLTTLMAEERRFRLTHAGQKLARLLPPEPRSPTLFYL